MTAVEPSAEGLLHDAVYQLADRIPTTDWDYDPPIPYSIGSLACCIAAIESPEAAVGFTEKQLARNGIEGEDEFKAWRMLGTMQVPAAIERAQQIAGVEVHDGKHSLRPELRSDLIALYNLTDLVKLGVTELAPLVHEYLPGLPSEGENLKYRARVAELLYKAGDATAVDLAVETAKQVKEQILGAIDPTAESEPEDGDIVQQITKAIAQGLSRHLNETEQSYAKVDLALWGIVEHALKQKPARVADAERARAEMLGVRYGAYVDAIFCKTGNDPDGKHRENIALALTVHADELGNEALKILDPLVAIGDAEAGELYIGTFLNEENRPPLEDIPRHSLAALARAGNTEAKSLLLQIAHTSDDPLLYVYALEEAGMKDESLALARQLYALSPSRDTALTILNQEFSIPIWREMVQYPLNPRYFTKEDLYLRTKDVIRLGRFVTGRSDLAEE